MEGSKLQLSDRFGCEDLDRSEQRLFGNLNEVDQVQQRLSGNLTSSWFKSYRTIIQFYLDGSLVRLSSTSEVDQLRNELVSVAFHPRLKPKMSAWNGVEEGLGMNGAPEVRSQSQWRKKLIIYGYLVFATYLAIKIGALTKLQYNFDTLLETMHTLKTSNNLSDRNYHDCTCKQAHQDRPLSDSIACTRISSIFTWLELYGNPITSLTGLCICCYSITAILVIYYFTIPVICISAIKLRPDNLAFVFDPVGERSRIHREVTSIGDDLIQTVRRYKTCADLRSKAFVRTLLDLSCQSKPLVEPANIQAKWHRQSTKYWAASLLIDSVGGFVIANTYFYGSVICELLLRSRYRLQQLGFHSNAFSLVNKKGNFYFELKQLSETDLAAYQAFDGSIWSYLNLALLVETRYSLSWQKVLVSLEVVSIIVIAATSGSFYTCLYLNSCLDKIVWMNQILGQIEHCSSLLQLARERRREGLSIGRARYSDDEDVKISKLITISYLNFELFRRQQKFQQKLLNCCLRQALALGLSTLFICYIVGSKLESAYKIPILLLATYIICLVNISLTSGAYLTHKIDCICLTIMKLLARSVAHRTNSSISYPIFYWRRHMMEERIARQMLAPSALGISLTFENIVTFNAYLAGLWLLLSK